MVLEHIIIIINDNPLDTAVNLHVALQTCRQGCSPTIVM